MRQTRDTRLISFLHSLCPAPCALPPRLPHRYHLGLGCSLQDGDERFLYEGGGGGSPDHKEDRALQVLPTVAIIAAHPSIFTFPLHELLPGMNPVGGLRLGR